jgi:hypothetical protein
MTATTGITPSHAIGYPAAPRARAVRRADAVRAASRRLAATLLVLMAAGSLALWTVVPAGVLWLASHAASSSTELSAAPALVALVGIPVAIGLGARALARLERVYLRLAGSERRRSRQAPAWRRSMSDSSSHREPSVLERLMVASVLVAAITFTGWFLTSAHVPVVSA